MSSVKGIINLKTRCLEPFDAFSSQNLQKEFEQKLNELNNACVSMV